MSNVSVDRSLNPARVLFLCALVCLVCCPLDAQFLPSTPQARIPDASGHSVGDQPDEAQRELQARQQKRRNEARQQDIVKDTGKLLALATELKSEVDKTNKDVLSLDVIKKADQIEKLSKSIKERMKD